LTFEDGCPGNEDSSSDLHFDIIQISFFVVFYIVLLEVIPDHGYHTGGETIYIRGGIFVEIFIYT
jgi:hypothetical protein